MNRSDLLVVTPKVHRVTFYTCVPYLIFFTALHIIGKPDSEAFGYFVILCFATVFLLLKALVTPWLMPTIVKPNSISSITQYGGEIVIELDELALEYCYTGVDGLHIQSNTGQTLHLNNTLYAAKDLEKILQRIVNLIDKAN